MAAVAAARWSTTLGGGAAAVNAPFCLLFLVHSLLLSSLYTFLTLKSPNANPKLLDLTKKKTKEKGTTFMCYLDGLVLMLVSVRNGLV